MQIPKETEPTDTYDVYDGPEHRGSIEVPRGTDRGRLDTAVVEKFGVRFDRLAKRPPEPPPRDA